MCAVGIWLLKRLKVAGICGYPSKTGGRRAFVKFGFNESVDTFIQGDERQPVCWVEGSEVPDFGKLLRKRKKGMERLIPVWDSADQAEFAREVPS
jgi:hypothetical protein